MRVSYSYLPLRRMRSGLRRNGIGVHSSDRCHCVTSWPNGVAELVGSQAASYRRNRAINAQCKCGKTTLLMNSVRSFVTGDRARRRRRFEDGSTALKKVVARSSHASGLSPVQIRKSHPVLTNSARDPRQCAVEAARGRRDHPWSAIAPVVGR
jgi:hypothetical protein